MTVTPSDIERARAATAEFVGELRAATRGFPAFAALGREAEESMDRDKLALLLQPSLYVALRNAAIGLRKLNEIMAEIIKE
jgi:hypothetical protein